MTSGVVELISEPRQPRARLTESLKINQASESHWHPTPRRDDYLPVPTTSSYSGEAAARQREENPSAGTARALAHRERGGSKRKRAAMMWWVSAAQKRWLGLGNQTSTRL
ncbi:Os01g0738700 [Oryza sativa Japonica Group]|uniref:Os01g0738700 protein n=1 Tax=Oryza sativa subsp. japonica TaxID=39947 RepID=C7IXY6_ORYSJ|nr:Os01g0738700 [Oryza sativa Japonica Group]|eukprot:NP_001172559.1 Os01g0738700 [Oryza sativa Japonica Group]